jgi:peroxiredoxin
VGISVDSAKKSAELAETLGVPFPLLQDANLKTAIAYGVAEKENDIAIPAVFVVSRDGHIAWRAIGDAINDHPAVEHVLQKVLELKESG